jgi:hypothetical protein
MGSLPGLPLKIGKAAAQPEQGAGTISMIIQRPYTRLKKQLRRAFEWQEDVNIIVDRRYRERRASKEPFAAERRRADRRRLKEQLVEVILLA